MKYIIIFMVLAIALHGVIYWSSSGISFAENYDVKADDESQAVEKGGYHYQEGDPITQEMIDQEEEWLEKKINEINETPVEKFGSLVLKREKRIYYAHRLELLHESPEQYFKTKTDK